MPRPTWTNVSPFPEFLEVLTTARVTESRHPERDPARGPVQVLNGRAAIGHMSGDSHAQRYRRQPTRAGAGSGWDSHRVTLQIRSTSCIFDHERWICASRTLVGGKQDEEAH